MTTVTEPYAQEATTGLPNMCYCNVQQVNLQIFFKLYVECGSLMSAWYFTSFLIFMTSTTGENMCLIMSAAESVVWEYSQFNIL